MKKTAYIVALLCLFISNSLLAQDDKDSKISIIANGGIGYGIMNNDDEADYNLNSNSGELLINFKLSERTGIATGVGLYELTGNGFNSLGNFFHQRSFIKVPVLLTQDYSFNENFKMLASFGVYGQGIVKDEYRFVNNTQEDVFEGWNFGAQIGVGLLYDVTKEFSLGVNFTGQSDFTRLESNSGSGINDEQRMKNLNTIGMVFMLKL